MKKTILYIFLTLAIPFGAMLIGCGHDTKAWHTLDTAERLMNIRPDSALTILSTIDKRGLGDEKAKARYALLLSMALDKNYIDTTTFEVLQPAINYYPANGSDNDKLRTLYYQGRIYQNKNNYDAAMQCFLKASDLKDYNDTLTFANMLVAQGKIKANSYQMESYVNCNRLASDLYNKIGEQRRELASLIRALDGSITLGYKDSSDSILNYVDSLSKMYPEIDDLLLKAKLAYVIRFDSENDVAFVLDSISDFTQYDSDTKLNMVLGYLKLDEPFKAKMIFESIDSNKSSMNSSRYIAIKPMVLEATQEYRQALEAYKNFHSAVESENSKIFSQKTTVAQDLHELELKHIHSIQNKNQQIWTTLCLGLFFIIIISVLYLQLILRKKNKVISEQNMRLRISHLESECENLKKSLEESSLPKQILCSIQERIGILNGLLAAKISNNNLYSKPYDKWINQTIEDRERFMGSTRLAFRASHPAFMKYLDDHGLTESEQNYVCLYAIGLRGKEIGEYIKIKRHYHTSTDIRKKLGLNEDDTNLGLHIRNILKNL